MNTNKGVDGGVVGVLRKYADTILPGKLWDGNNRYCNRPGFDGSEYAYDLAALREAIRTVEAMAEALEDAMSKLHELADDFASPQFSDRHGDGPEMRAIADKAAEVLIAFHGSGPATGGGKVEDPYAKQEIRRLPSGELVGKCMASGCNNVATHHWSGWPTCNSCGSESYRGRPDTPFQPAATPAGGGDLPEPALEWPTGAWLRNGSRVLPGNYYTAEQMREYGERRRLASAPGDDTPEVKAAIDRAHDNYMRGNIDATTRDWQIAKARERAAPTQQNGSEQA